MACGVCVFLPVLLILSNKFVTSYFHLGFLLQFSYLSHAPAIVLPSGLEVIAESLLLIFFVF